MTICPSCNGPHLEGLRFQHKSICDFYNAEAQTQAADHERFRANRGQPVTREATEAEILLLDALDEDDYQELVKEQHPGQETPHAVTVTVDFTGSLWRRSITKPTTSTEETL